ncbi:MAG TPA: hypothetical protein VFL36_15225 [Myxococcales bacterium]|nr:hypothetical protein [Myxococcales bacterium]
MPAKDLLRGPPAGPGEVHADAAAVALDGSAADEAALLQLVDEQHHVRPAGQQARPQIAGLLRAQVQERLQEAELAGRKARPIVAQAGSEPLLDGGGAARQLDQCVEGADFRRGSLVVGGQA